MDINPPKFVISVNNADHFHFSYTRYIENKIREFFEFEGTPIEIEMKSRKSMFKSKEKGGAMEDYFQGSRGKHDERVQDYKQSSKNYEYEEEDDFDE